MREPVRRRFVTDLPGFRRLLIRQGGFVTYGNIALSGNKNSYRIVIRAARRGARAQRRGALRTRGTIPKHGPHGPLWTGISGCRSLSRRTRASRGRLSVLASRFSARVSHLRGVSPHHSVLSSARSCGMFYRTVVLERKNEEKTRWLSRPRSGEGDEGKAALGALGGSHM